ncbi:hypothetical protein CRV15_02750 [Streptomyces clavuligerus]|nr:hypothetical protein D1794_03320 [Streptomyces clavuligerus]QCS04615.1 hypothetical protein CRV15_02750 [Streptomyces clavuligerus]
MARFASGVPERAPTVDRARFLVPRNLRALSAFGARGTPSAHSPRGRGKRPAQETGARSPLSALAAPLRLTRRRVEANARPRGDRGPLPAFGGHAPLRPTRPWAEAVVRPRTGCGWPFPGPSGGRRRACRGRRGFVAWRKRFP